MYYMYIYIHINWCVYIYMYISFYIFAYMSICESKFIISLKILFSVTILLIIPNLNLSTVSLKESDIWK